MAEIPSNVLLAEKFAEIFDGFSIGSNDLTQLTLGIDRDSTLVANIFSEQNEAAEQMISMMIKKANACGTHIGFMRPGAQRFSGFCTVPRAARHQQYFFQCRRIIKRN